MRKKLNLNDLHVGATRVAGATPQTALALRLSLLGKVRALLMAHLDKDVIINGDVFDAFEINMGDALALYEIVVEWLDESAEEPPYLDGEAPPEIIIGMGNHDYAKDSSKLSIFAFIGAVLQSAYPTRVRIISKPTTLWEGFYMIPHCVNQEVFNQELELCVNFVSVQDDSLAPLYIFLHANLHNHFAIEADHSLNVSREQVQALVAAGHTLIFGHIHQQADEPGVVVMGNQFPTSVADCIGNDTKRAALIDPALPRSKAAMEFIETWKAEGSFTRIDWRLLNGDDVVGEFIRVEGTCTAEEAAHMIQAVSKLRQRSSAYVVANAVKVDGVGDMEDIEGAAEDMKGIDVLNFLFEQLEPEQAAVVKRLLEARDNQ